MTENQLVGQSPSINNTVVLRVPKPNIQIVVLGLIAVITLFQTFQKIVDLSALFYLSFLLLLTYY